MYKPTDKPPGVDDPQSGNGDNLLKSAPPVARDLEEAINAAIPLARSNYPFDSVLYSMKSGSLQIEKFSDIGLEVNGYMGVTKHMEDTLQKATGLEVILNVHEGQPAPELTRKTIENGLALVALIVARLEANAAESAAEKEHALEQSELRSQALRRLPELTDVKNRTGNPKLAMILRAFENETIRIVARERAGSDVDDHEQGRQELEALWAKEGKRGEALKAPKDMAQKSTGEIFIVDTYGQVPDGLGAALASASNRKVTLRAQEGKAPEFTEDIVEHTSKFIAAMIAEMKR